MTETDAIAARTRAGRGLSRRGPVLATGDVLSRSSPAARAEGGGASSPRLEEAWRRQGERGVMREFTVSLATP